MTKEEFDAMPSTRGLKLNATCEKKPMGIIKTCVHCSGYGNVGGQIDGSCGECEGKGFNLIPVEPQPIYSAEFTEWLKEMYNVWIQSKS